MENPAKNFLNNYFPELIVFCKNCYQFPEMHEEISSLIKGELKRLEDFVIFDNNKNFIQEAFKKCNYCDSSFPEISNLVSETYQEV